MKSFCYNTSHLTLLYKYRTTRILFMTLFCFVILLQSVSWLIVWMNGTVASVMDMVFVGVTLIVSLIQFISHSWLYAYNNRIIREVETNGSAVGLMSAINFNDKTSFGNGLIVFCRILTVVFAIFVGIAMFNFVQDFLNWGKVMLKIPALVMLVVISLNLSGMLRFNKLVLSDKVK